jgi:hypothetical protein
MRLCEHIPLPACLQRCQRLGQQAQLLTDLTSIPCGFGEQE